MNWGKIPFRCRNLKFWLRPSAARIESFFDRHGPIGQWMLSEEAVSIS
jgi:hypothetical protein